MVFRKNMIIRLLALSLLTVVGNVLYAAEGDVHTLLDTSNLRMGPGSSYQSIRSVDSGVQVVELERQGEWIRVKTQGGQAGWIYAASLKAVSLVKTRQPAAAASQHAQDIVIADVLEPARAASSSKTDGKKATASSNEQAIIVEDVLNDHATPEAAPVDTVIAEPEVVAVDQTPVVSSADQDVEVADVLNGHVKPEAAALVEAVAAEPEVIATDQSVASSTGQDVVVADVLNGHAMPEVAAVEEAVAAAEPEVEAPTVDQATAVSSTQNVVVADVLNAHARPEVAVVEEAVAAEPVVEAPVVDQATAVSSTGQDVVVADVLNGHDNPDVAAVEQSQPVTRAPGEKRQVIHHTTIRTGPGSLFDVLGWAGMGAKVIELERQGQWLKVQMQESGRVGWIDASSLEDGPRPQAEIVKAQSEQPAVAKISQQATVSESEMEIANDPEKSESVAETIVEVVTAAPVHKEQEIKTHLFRFNKKANLRAGPAVKFDVVTWAGANAYAEEIDRRGEWVRVRMQESKRIGWVFNSSLNLTKKAGVTRVVKAGPTSSTSGSAVVSENLHVFKQNGNLRAGPGRTFDVIAWASEGAIATELERRGDWVRVKMSASKRIGWAFGNLLKFAGTMQTTPVATTSHVISSGDVSIVKNMDQIPTSTESADQPITVSPKVKLEVKVGALHKVLSTTMLRSNADQDYETSGVVSAGDFVTVVEQQDQWVKIKPKKDVNDTGWLKSVHLQMVRIKSASQKTELASSYRVDQYKDRITHSGVFNFSYQVLEHALYNVPIEELSLSMDERDLEALYRKRKEDQSSFDIEVETETEALHGRVVVLGSSTRNFHKKSLYIKLDKEGGRWHGHRKIALRSMASDKAMMREWLSWKLMAAMGMKVPEVHFTRVVFNGGSQRGLYLSIEWMGRKFLENNQMDPDGEFFQPDDATFCGNLKAENASRLEECFEKITPEDDDFSSLSLMAQAMADASIENIDTVLETYFDVQSVLNWITVNGIVSNGDTYNKNYWLYRDVGLNKWTMIPWDYNLTFGRTYDPYVPYPHDIFNKNFQYFYPPDVGASNALKDKALRNPRLRLRLEQNIRHLLGLEPNGPESTYGWFSPAVMKARIDHVSEAIADDVRKDTFIDYDMTHFKKASESLTYFSIAHAHFLKAKLFGDFPWVPVDPNAPILFDAPVPPALFASGTIEPGQDTLRLTDAGWGYHVASLVLDTPAESAATFKVHIEGERLPKYLPPGKPSRLCVKRSWIVHTEMAAVSATGDLTFEYLQENTKRSEVPATAHENKLELWMLDNNRWRQVPTYLNEYSNTLTAKNIRLQSGHIQRFVACSPF